MPLSFEQLRHANVLRLPLFKNKHGEPAHTEPDGSDWSPAQWLQAVVGELSEYANLRKKYERGDISESEFLYEGAKELADVQIYLDLLAFRIGVNLGQATADKWDEVSERIGINLRINNLIPNHVHQGHFESLLEEDEHGNILPAGTVDEDDLPF